VEPLAGLPREGLLTGYYEPLLEATREPTRQPCRAAVPAARHAGQRRPWYTRQEMDTLPEARAALRGREIAYLADPLDALVLQIQGSGRVRITEPDGSQRWCAWPLPAATTSRTAASAAGCCSRA
jgi:membrane-bound lytic murein transglycosylase A